MIEWYHLQFKGSLCTIRLFYTWFRIRWNHLFAENVVLLKKTKKCWRSHAVWSSKKHFFAYAYIYCQWNRQRWASHKENELKKSDKRYSLHCPQSSTFLLFLFFVNEILIEFFLHFDYNDVGGHWAWNVWHNNIWN